MKVKTQDLIGAALDWAVAKCEGHDAIIYKGIVRAMNPHFGPELKYSSDWCQGGPIIERERITLDARESDWQARIWSDEKWDFIEIGKRGAYCKTPLVAAMRCYVASKLGDEVEIPDESI